MAGIGRSPGWAQLNAIVSGLIVFLVLYLAEGFRLFGRHSVEFTLWWLGEMNVLLWWVVFSLLLPFASVAYYVYRLKRRMLMSEIAGEIQARDSAQADERERELRGNLKDAELRALAEKHNAQGADRRWREAEQRAQIAEAAAREAAQQPGVRAQNETGGRDNKFVAAKRVFARLYHPDNIRAEGFDKMVRAEIFKEFWRELEIIEKG